MSAYRKGIRTREVFEEQAAALGWQDCVLDIVVENDPDFPVLEHCLSNFETSLAGIGISATTRKKSFKWLYNTAVDILGIIAHEKEETNCYVRVYRNEEVFSYNLSYELDKRRVNFLQDHLFKINACNSRDELIKYWQSLHNPLTTGHVESPYIYMALKELVKYNFSFVEIAPNRCVYCLSFQWRLKPGE